MSRSLKTIVATFAVLALGRAGAITFYAPPAFDWPVVDTNGAGDALAVGFLAAITARLANAGISVNAVSAFHHDHLFVPERRAGEALRLLQDMQQQS